MVYSCRQVCYRALMCRVRRLIVPAAHEREAQNRGDNQLEFQICRFDFEPLALLSALRRQAGVEPANII